MQDGNGTIVPRGTVLNPDDGARHDRVLAEHNLSVVAVEVLSQRRRADKETCQQCGQAEGSCPSLLLGAHVVTHHNPPTVGERASVPLFDERRYTGIPVASHHNSILNRISERPGSPSLSAQSVTQGKTPTRQTPQTKKARGASLGRYVKWWRRWVSNPRPQACKACALPAELRPHISIIAPAATRLTLGRLLSKKWWAQQGSNL